jgi:hypothetical protein
LVEHTVPEKLSPNQVLVDARGHMQLLGTALDNDNLITEPNEETRCLTLLKRTSSLLMEGKDLLNENKHRFCAPMPLAAQNVFGKLLTDPRPLGEIHSLLKELKQKPQEVSRARRFVHAAIATAISLTFFASFLLMMQFAPLIIAASGVALTKSRLDGLKEKLDSDALTQVAVAGIQPSPELRLGGLAVHHAERKNWDISSEWHTNQTEWLAARQKWTFIPSGGMIRNQVKNSESFSKGFGKNLRRQELWSSNRTNLTVEFQPSPLAGIGIPCIFALFGIAWSTLTRGGLIFRLLGMQLVRADGRAAAYWQCALRSLLFWAPQIALLGGALALDAQYRNNWFAPASRESMRWLTWFSWTMWWFGIAMLPVGIIQTIWTPQRDWHDRLVGTWIVPRF